MSDDHTPRWKYRFDNFQGVFDLLRQAMDQYHQHGLSQLEKEGAVQRFEYTMELAWKTIKDYLEYQQLALPQPTPRAVVREAFATGLVRDGQVWMDALDARNKMSHVYDINEFTRVIDEIQARYLPAIEELNLRLAQLQQEEQIDG